MSASISSKEQVSTSEWIRSRALMEKWYWHLGQTLRFSSSSLSNTIASHLGLRHLVHNPSGISRLRDLPPPSLGFFKKAGSAPEAGGLTAATAVSMPSGFFLKEGVAIVGIKNFN